MKKRYNFILGLALLGTASCSDFLEVDSPSAFTDDYVMGNLEEADRSMVSMPGSVAIIPMAMPI